MSEIPQRMLRSGELCPPELLDQADSSCRYLLDDETGELDGDDYFFSLQPEAARHTPACLPLSARRRRAGASLYGFVLHSAGHLQADGSLLCSWSALPGRDYPPLCRPSPGTLILLLGAGSGSAGPLLLPMGACACATKRASVCARVCVCAPRILARLRTYACACVCMWSCAARRRRHVPRVGGAGP